jgi:hypothetical protein
VLLGRPFREHIGNMGIYWEPIGNLKGTCWEQNEKNPTSQLKRNKSMHFECMLSLPIDCMKFLFPKLVNPSLHHQVLQSLQLMKFLWGPILTPSNKIVNSDSKITNHHLTKLSTLTQIAWCLTSQLLSNFSRTFFSTPRSLLGPDPHRGIRSSN